LLLLRTTRLPVTPSASIPPPLISWATSFVMLLQVPSYAFACIQGALTKGIDESSVSTKRSEDLQGTHAGLRLVIRSCLWKRVQESTRGGEIITAQPYAPLCPAVCQ
jgi:hypothetical protein